MDKELASKMKEIQALEAKYGLMLFRFGLTHLVDMGVSQLSDNAAVEECIASIIEQGERDKQRKEAGERVGISLMSPEYQCEILRCAAELAKFSIWTLFAYIQNHVVIGEAAAPKQKKCDTCGCKLVWEHPDKLGQLQKSPANIDDWDICRNCMIEHCCDTNCMGCYYGEYPDCQFLEMKRRHMPRV